MGGGQQRLKDELPPRPVMPSSPSVSPQALSSSKLSLETHPLFQLLWLHNKPAQASSNFKQQCLLTLSMWVRNVDKHSALHMVSCSEVEGRPPRGGHAPGERGGSASGVNIFSCEVHRGRTHFTAAF